VAEVAAWPSALPIVVSAGEKVAEGTGIVAGTSAMAVAAAVGLVLAPILTYHSGSLVSDADEKTLEANAKAALAKAKAAALATAAVIQTMQRIHLTYRLTNPVTGQIYFGRVSGYGTAQQVLRQRFASHRILRIRGFGNPTVDVSLRGEAAAFAAIRGREQQLIDAAGGVGSARVANSIRGVSRSNVAGRFYWAASNVAFGPLAPYTGN
jgi:hypothetical protein